MGESNDAVVSAGRHASRGMELADRGWLDEAVSEFRKAVALDPRNAEHHANLAALFAQKERYREALAEFLVAVELDPEDAAAHHDLGLFLATFGRQAAIAELEEATARGPDEPNSFLELGLALREEEDRVEEARAALERAIALAPDDPVARHELASLLLEEGDARAAIQELKEVLRLDPDCFEAHLDLGICYTEKGFFDEAERCYRRAEALKETEPLLYYNHAALCALSNRVEDAKARLTLAFELDRRRVRKWIREDERLFACLATDPDFQQMRLVPPPSKA